METHCRRCELVIERVGGQYGIWYHLQLADHDAAPPPYPDPELEAFLALEAAY
jgi:hypothetical protein